MRWQPEEPFHKMQSRPAPRHAGAADCAFPGPDHVDRSVAAGKNTNFENALPWYYPEDFYLVLLGHSESVHYGEK